jgi:anti-sigma regulatory factor (Ser/Thr protein kinase)
MMIRGRPNGQSHSHQPGPDLEQPFDAASLVALRSTVAAHADRLGLREETIADVVLAVHELATNAVRHGGGGGRLRMWSTDGCLLCEVSDKGAGFTYLKDQQGHPPLGATGGRGLWIVAQLGEWFDVRTGPDGTVATVAIPLS